MCNEVFCTKTYAKRTSTRKCCWEERSLNKFWDIGPSLVILLVEIFLRKDNLFEPSKWISGFVFIRRTSLTPLLNSNLRPTLVLFSRWVGSTQLKVDERAVDYGGLVSEQQYYKLLGFWNTHFYLLFARSVATPNCTQRPGSAGIGSRDHNLDKQHSQSNTLWIQQNTRQEANKIETKRRDFRRVTYCNNRLCTDISDW